MALQKSILLIIATVLSFEYPLFAGEVGAHSAANEAFDRYVQSAEAAMGNATPNQLLPKLFRIDRLSTDDRIREEQALARGEIVIAEIHGQHDVPGGLIHHWIGTALFPRASLQQTLDLLQSYDRYPQIYAPAVERASVLRRTGDDFQIFLRLRQKKVLTVIFNTEYAVHYTRLSATEAAKRSVSTRIAQLEDHSDREKPPGEDSGYLWRLNTYWRLRETPAGTLAECESISLSRAIPVGLGWLVGPFVKSIPRDSLRFTLESTRKALPEK